ncbi:MAG: tRNA (5-methylaminomethyl-2-thiouridine)(34)-methyltransferase MnmD [Candidatus Nanoarchaeia archaeon]
MKKIITNDSSTTFYNDTVNETYHTTSGAIEEAQKKHVFPSQILQRIQKDKLKKVTILDFCFGLGYNSLVAYTQIRKKYPDLQITILALENDIAIMQALQECSVPEEYITAQKLFFSAIQKYSASSKTIQKIDPHTTIVFYLDDAKESIKKIPSNNADVVFFDAFSPKKMPELWTTTIFNQVYRAIKKGATLTTYSCARHVRNNLKEAKFTVIDGPCVGRKSPSTIAIKK